MGGEIFHPGGVAFRLDVDAVRLRVLSFQVAVVVGKGFPQVQKSAVLFQRNGSQLIVDLAQPLFVQAGMAAAHLGPDRRNGLHVDLRVGQGLGDHIQHEPVVGEKAGIIPVPVEHVGAQQDIQHRGLLSHQYFQILVDGKKYRYQIFSYETVSDDSDEYTVGFEPDETFGKFVQRMAASSMKDTGIVPTKDDKVVTLSTCSTSGETYRFVVHGVRVDEH